MKLNRNSSLVIDEVNATNSNNLSVFIKYLYLVVLFQTFLIFSQQDIKATISAILLTIVAILLSNFKNPFNGGGGFPPAS